MPRAGGALRLECRWLLAVSIMAMLVVGLVGGLIRIGALPFWPWAGPALAWHGPLMICGFFSTVIALERAVALHRSWVWLSPSSAALGALAALFGVSRLAQVLWALGAALLCLAYLQAWRRQPVQHTAVEGAGAVCLLVGVLTWALSVDLPAALPWWMSFLVFTIAGERRELARFVPLSASARRTFIVVLLAQTVGLVLGSVPAGAGAGALLWWVSMIALSGWLWRHDMACRPRVGLSGWALHTRHCLQWGYAYLGLAGAWGAAATLGAAGDGTGPMHGLLLGFVFAMVFGHAPIVLPALTGLSAVPVRPAWWAAPLMGASLLLRALGQWTGMPGLLALSGLGHVLALLWFVGAMLVALRRAGADKAGRCADGY